ncbi:MAG: hypothetical protein H7X80_03480, partial [bacterium]|nr:hypothetical protein [Candidatus Kapabacteria bacterium]
MHRTFAIVSIAIASLILANTVGFAQNGQWLTDIGVPGIEGADVNVIYIDGDDVYVGGNFGRAGSNNATSLAVWNRVSKTWSVLPGTFSSSVRSIVRFQGNLVVAGDFFSIDSLRTNGIARWDGQRWDTLGAEFNSSVADLLVDHDTLYAAGYFSVAAGNEVLGVARYVDGVWSAVDLGLNGYVSSLAGGNGKIYAGGDFMLEQGTSHNVAEYDGSEWRPLGSGVSSFVNDLVVHDGDLYAAGDFYYAGTERVNGLARWNGTDWAPVGSDDNIGIVNELATDGTYLYAAGAFTWLSGQPVDGVAKWNGATWEPVGSLNGSLSAIAIVGSEVYAGGRVTRADEATVNNIAHFNGTTWGTMGDGLLDGHFTAWIEASAIIGDEVFVGGTFSHAGGIPSMNIASWNRRTKTWSAIGEGTNERVRAMTAVDGELIVVGEFTRAGDINTNHIAKFNPVSRMWSLVGEGTRAVISDVVAVGDDIYVAADGVFKWDGVEWTWDSSGPDGWVYALEHFNGELYASGSFTASGNIQTVGIARMASDGWHPLGNGLEGYVIDMTPHGTDLIVAGQF